MSEVRESEKMQNAELQAQMEDDNNEFKKLLEASLKEQKILRRGEIVTGVVVNRNQDVVTIDVGAKAEGDVPATEFRQADLPLPELGDEVEVMVQSLGDADGVKLSVLAARRRKAWALVEKAVESGESIEGVVTAEVKGGFRVSLGGLDAFMPRSEADASPHVDPESLIGKRFPLAVLDARRKPENIVVSRRKPIIAEQEAKRAAFFAKAKVGDKVSGEVKRMTDFGAFVDIGGVDALLHISDICWRRLRHPSEMLSIGQKVTAEITKISPEAGKVSISMKALQPDPWEKVASTYEPGMRLTGTVRRLLDFGAMVELEPGVEGLIHRSELSWLKRDVNPASVLSEGDVVDVAVLDVDVEARRISLSLKSVTENPWQVWLSEHPVGSRVRGRIKNITDFGFFVSVGEGLDGLVHLDNISWERNDPDLLKDFSKGQEVETVVLGVDVEKQRISLGIKQLVEDPFEVFLAGVRRGQSVNGEIVEIKPTGAMVELAKGVTGFLPRREFPKGEDEEPKVGDTVEAKVINVDRKRRQVELSVRQHLRDEERRAVKQYLKQTAKHQAPSPLALELRRKLLKQPLFEERSTDEKSDKE